MNETKPTWRERPSESKFVASVWTCHTRAATTRTVLADPCISIAFVKEGGTKVIIRGPETKSRTELLAPGYTCTTIRLQPGVLLKGFPIQKFMNNSLVLPVDATSRFWFEGAHLQFPGFNNAEVIIAQLESLGLLSENAPDNDYPQTVGTLSARTHYRVTKRTTGFSPYQLYQLRRIHQALRLLKQGVSATTVASELKFTDQSHLIHASKQFLGCTPRQLSRLPQTPYMSSV